MSFELIRRGPDGIDGILSLYEIPNEFAEDKELFDAWWLPRTEIGRDGLYHIIEPARISDEAKAQRLVMPPMHNLITNLGISLILTNLSVTTQAAMFPVTQIMSVGNGTCTGVLRTDTSVPGDAFVATARKAPTSYAINGFLTTIITNYGTTDAVGTWTNAGWYGYKVASAQNATTTGGTGALMSHVLFPFVKSNSASYSINYAFLMGN